MQRDARDEPGFHGLAADPADQRDSRGRNPKATHLQNQERFWVNRQRHLCFMLPTLPWKRLVETVFRDAVDDTAT